MFKIVKGKDKLELTNRQLLNIYLANGWSIQKKVTDEVVKQVEKIVKPVLPDNKKELQERLDQKGIKYTPRDSKDTLRKKLEQSSPADDFNDGLLKG